MSGDDMIAAIKAQWPALADVRLEIKGTSPSSPASAKSPTSSSSASSS